MTTSNTLLCHHGYIWSDCGHADSTWRKVPRSLLHDKHRSESVYPHNFRLVAFGERYVERRRNIVSGSIAIKDVHDNLIGSISFPFVQAHCLARVTAVAVLCSPQTSWLRSPCLFFPLGPIWRIPYCSCYPAQLDWFEWRLWCLWFVGFNLPPDFISGYAFRMISSTESFIIIWRRTVPILNSSTNEDIGSCRFQELVYKPTFEKQGGTPNHLRRYLLLYRWIRSTRDSAISYTCKGPKRRGGRPCW